MYGNSMQVCHSCFVVFVVFVLVSILFEFSLFVC